MLFVFKHRNIDSNCLGVVVCKCLIKVVCFGPVVCYVAEQEFTRIGK